MSEYYSTEMSDEAMAEATDRALRSGRVDLSNLLYGIRMLRDGNRMKDPISRADRLLLAMRAFEEAVEAAEQVAERLGSDAPLAAAEQARKQMEPQFFQLSSECLRVFHEERREVLAKSKSGKRQLISALATLKKLKRLCARYQEEPIAGQFDEVWQYWQDQADLLADYD